MSKLAFLFPGQGSQYAGMGKELAARYAVAGAVFEEADAVLEWPRKLSGLCFEGPDEELKLTANTQPAILAVSVAAARVLEEKGVQPDYGAGHSLGEYSALVTAGALSLRDALATVQNRGRYMQEAVPAGQGAMAALLGLAHEKVESVCRQAAQGQVVAPANLNSPEQIVIAGNTAAVERAVRLATAAGAKRAVLLPVSAPFHCALLEPAAERLAADLARITFRALRFPVVNNVDAEVVRTGAAARDALRRQVTAPVRWEESIRKLIALGCTRFIEVGPGKVLRGLLRQIDRAAVGYNVEDEESLQTTLERLTATTREAAS